MDSKIDRAVIGIGAFLIHMNNYLSQKFGTVTMPQTNFSSEPGLALGELIQLSLRLLIIGAAVYALFNLVFAGYSFMSAGEDSKKVSAAWSKIYQTMIGLAFAAGAFVLAAIFGQLIFGDWNFILSPTIPEL